MNRHPTDPRSNVAKFSGYDPDKYALDRVTLTVRTNEDFTPGRPPCLTQQSIGMYLQPLTRELVAVPPRPSIDELPDAVLDQMVQKDKAFWVDKPGNNAYTLHEAYYSYGMTTEMIKPPHQDVFPRSYQYDLDCVKFRQRHACDGLKPEVGGEKKPISPHCSPCGQDIQIGIDQQDKVQKRWKYYPHLTASLSREQIRELMNEVGRPFHNIVCNWYYINYPSQKYDIIIRKFSQ